MPYRPERLTPKPKLYGIMNGTIDSELDTGRADIDELGRYKVMMPFDISGVAPGMGSRRIRMAQPYGGGGSGMSFPLIKGTEVIWTCIDGDIDRPIITGAVPNPLNPSVTNTDNANSNVIRTSSGITMGFHDGSGSGAGQNATGGGANGGLAAQQQQQYHNVNYELKTSSVKSNQNIDVSTPMASSKWPDYTSLQPITQQQQMMADDLKLIGNASTSGATTQNSGKQWALKVPDYNETGGDTTGTDHKDSYLRLGKASDMEKIKSEGKGNELWGKSGWLDYTDGDRVSITQGKSTDIINNGYLQKISGGDKWTSVKFNIPSAGEWPSRKFSWSVGSSLGISVGDNMSLSAAASLSGSVGLKTSFEIASSLSCSFGASVSYKKAIDVSYGSGISINHSGAKSVSTAKSQEISGNLSTKINVKSGMLLEATTQAVGLGATAIGAAVTSTLAAAATAGIAGAADGDDDKASDWASVASSTVTAGIYATSAALVAATRAKALADLAALELAAKAETLSELSLMASGLRLGIGQGGNIMPVLSTTITPGIAIFPGKIEIGFGPSCQIVMTSAGITFTAPKVDVLSPGSITIGSPTSKTSLIGSKVDIGTPATALSLNGSNMDATFVNFLYK
jgi:hypothetical protein